MRRRTLATSTPLSPNTSLASCAASSCEARVARDRTRLARARTGRGVVPGAGGAPS
jgi:hypothetical protein